MAWQGRTAGSRHRWRHRLSRTDSTTSSLTRMAETLALVNPATEAVIRDQPLATAADTDTAIERAAAALPAWRALAPLDRIKVMRRFADMIARHADELAHLET